MRTYFIVGDDRGYVVVNRNGRVLLNLTGKDLRGVSIESLAICGDLGLPITLGNSFCWGYEGSHMVVWSRGEMKYVGGPTDVRRLLDRYKRRMSI